MTAMDIGRSIAADTSSAAEDIANNHLIVAPAAAAPAVIATKQREDARLYTIANCSRSIKIIQKESMDKV